MISLRACTPARLKGVLWWICRCNSRLADSGGVERRCPPPLNPALVSRRSSKCAWLDYAGYLHTSPFAENEIFYKNQASTELAVATQDTRGIIGAALKALDAVFIPGHRYHRGGVILTDFRSGKVSQLTLFDEYHPQHNGDKLMELLDRINGSGKAKI
ncbi:hypothetical protein [Serratia rubidaea]|uniref:DinB/UmuC family translesion DNA polymerase n=1 Tax=Serratia rubidaea TaxID=61652 RepID=UPI003B83A58E